MENQVRALEVAINTRLWWKRSVSHIMRLTRSAREKDETNWLPPVSGPGKMPAG
jgi:hypothetical protein